VVVSVEDLAAVTADRDKWRDLSRMHERERNRLRRRLREHDRLLNELAARMVGALEGAGYIQVSPRGPEPKEQDEDS
jgi:hypothetical protein